MQPRGVVIFALSATLTVAIPRVCSADGPGPGIVILPTLGGAALASFLGLALTMPQERRDGMPAKSSRWARFWGFAGMVVGGTNLTLGTVILIDELGEREKDYLLPSWLIGTGVVLATWGIWRLATSKRAEVVLAPQARGLALAARW